MLLSHAGRKRSANDNAADRRLLRYSELGPRWRVEHRSNGPCERGCVESSLGELLAALTLVDPGIGQGQSRHESGIEPVLIACFENT